MTSPRSLMVVSDAIDGVRRARIAAGREPRPEYLVLEQEHGVELLDWSRLGRRRGRTPALALRHAARAVAAAHRYDAILSDGEHVGIPVALARRALRGRFGHVVIGHHVTVPKKRAFFRVLRADAGMSMLVLHSRRQLALAHDELGVEECRLAFVPYAVDHRFWAPIDRPEERLVAAVGREHRDFRTLAEAGAALPLHFHVAAGSLHSPRATWSVPARWPANFDRDALDKEALRDLYARAAIVVVPLLENDFQAGVTTLLEAMAMARPVVVSATSGQRDIVQHGVTGMLVPPGDPAALAAVLEELDGDPALRRRLGSNAREAVQEQFTVDRYAGRLAEELRVAAGA